MERVTSLAGLAYHLTSQSEFNKFIEFIKRLTKTYDPVVAYETINGLGTQMVNRKKCVDVIKSFDYLLAAGNRKQAYVVEHLADILDEMHRDKFMARFEKKSFEVSRDN